jgi:sugar phosphate isomerase/epimerase
VNRREFLQQTLVGGAATTVAVSLAQVLASGAVRWPIGCFNRPWTTWSFDDALKQIKAAGYETMGLLTRTRQEPFIGADATPEYLASLKQRIASNGLKANMGALRTRHNIPLDDSIKETRKQIENADALALTYLLTFGVDRPLLLGDDRRGSLRA